MDVPKVSQLLVESSFTHSFIYYNHYSGSTRYQGSDANKDCLHLQEAPRRVTKNRSKQEACSELLHSPPEHTEHLHYIKNLTRAF